MIRIEHDEPPSRAPGGYREGRSGGRFRAKVGCPPPPEGSVPLAGITIAATLVVFFLWDNLVTDGTWSGEAIGAALAAFFLVSIPAYALLRRLLAKTTVTVEDRRLYVRSSFPSQRSPTVEVALNRIRTFVARPTPSAGGGMPSSGVQVLAELRDGQTYLLFSEIPADTAARLCERLEAHLVTSV